MDHVDKTIQEYREWRRLRTVLVSYALIGSTAGALVVLWVVLRHG